VGKNFEIATTSLKVSLCESSRGTEEERGKPREDSV
jgi:hypothetical protein